MSGGFVSERRRVVDESGDGSSATYPRQWWRDVILFGDKSLFN